MSRIHTKSQNFLRSPKIVKILLGHSKLSKTDIILDIGAGSGVITSVLAEKFPNIVAYENEPEAYKKLQKNLKDTSVKIKKQSFLDAKLPDEPYSIFSNIPFSISSKILEKLTDAKNSPNKIYILCQKQFAKKLLCENDNFTSMLGSQLTPWWHVKIRLPMKKTDYTPPPAVDTVFLELKKRTEILLPENKKQKYYDFVQKCYLDYSFFLKVTKDKNLPEKPSKLNRKQWLFLFENLGNSKTKR